MSEIEKLIEGYRARAADLEAEGFKTIAPSLPLSLRRQADAAEAELEDLKEAEEKYELIHKAWLDTQMQLAERDRADAELLKVMDLWECAELCHEPEECTVCATKRWVAAKETITSAPAAPLPPSAPSSVAPGDG